MTKSAQNLGPKSIATSASQLVAADRVARRRACRQSRKPICRPSTSRRLQGSFLELLVRISGARRILEIGTLGGYSTIWLARALPARWPRRHPRT